jgi:Na+-translocating ferredoxin:NAD+ oxidoreductase RnfD subunit
MQMAKPTDALLSPVRRYLRSPKGLMTAVLAGLLAIAGATVGLGPVLLSLVASASAAALVDAPILRVRRRRWTFPDGAILTALFVTMVLSRYEPWYVSVITSVVAVLTKYVARGRTANVFNPAALGLVVTFYLMGTGQDWWGSLPDAGIGGISVLLASGVLVANRVNKMPLVLVFLGTYFLLFTIAAFAGDPRLVVEIFRAPDVNAAIFFSAFILTDPPTSPVRYRDQITFGIIVAISAFGIFQALGAAHYLLSGLLVGNVWEAWKRRQADARRSSERVATRLTVQVNPTVS